MSQPNNELPKVFFIFQDLNLCKVLQYHLERKGFSVTCEPLSSQAHGWMKVKSSDVVMVDITTSNHQCVEMLSVLNKNAKAERPSIMLLGPANQEDVDAAYRLGIDEWLTTPFSMDRLVVRLRQLTSQTQKA